MKKVLIVNQGLSANIGDKAILLALTKYFGSRGYQVSIQGFTHYYETKIDDIDYKQYRQTRKFDLPILLKWNLKAKTNLEKKLSEITDKYDLLIIGGGQLIKSRCYFPFALEKWINTGRSIAKNIFLVGVGLDPSFTMLEKRKIKNSLKLVDGIFVRDSRSRIRLKKIFDFDSELIPDVAFILKKYIKFANYTRSGTVIMPFDYYTYRYHFKNKKSRTEYDAYWIDMIKEHAAANEDIKLMYTTIEDKRECFRIFDLLPKYLQDVVTIVEVNTVEEIVFEFLKTKNIYSARMHALILGLVAGTTVHSINFSDKLEAFEKEFILSSENADDYADKVIGLLDSLLNKKMGEQINEIS